ncbi:CFEM domain-containing protein [Colletotrichum fioriniae PJ7]|uniref:CFEM domain-containing protein n=1 Tax=Colletotrichum fioriniae PJ7 TaxID=1445577 RepID=A0A010S613_9PEZI|nr:CFEM domain-containing protein [Colletotrichum fioriniae PJ7]
MLTGAQLPEAQKYSKTSCRVPVRRNTDQGPITWTLFSIAVVALAARLISKIPSLNPAFSFGWDDWLILASTIALIPADIGSQILIGIGLGQDIWMVSPDNITQILLLFFVEELLYSFVVAVTKLSILIFYLRLFAETWFRVVCYVMLGVTTVYGIGQILGIVFVCSPVSYNWTQWDGEHQGKCGNVSVMAFINGGVNIVIDFILFILPVTQFIQHHCLMDPQEKDRREPHISSWVIGDSLEWDQVGYIGEVRRNAESDLRLQRTIDLVVGRNAHECHLCVYARDDIFYPTRVSSDVSHEAVYASIAGQESATNRAFSRSPDSRHFGTHHYNQDNGQSLELGELTSNRKEQRHGELDN